MGKLTEQERAILKMEARDWRTARLKEDVVREELGLSSTHYYQLLGPLIDREEALAYDPVTVGRLRRLRESRRRR